MRHPRLSSARSAEAPQGRNARWRWARPLLLLAGLAAAYVAYLAIDGRESRPTRANGNGAGIFVFSARDWESMVRTHGSGGNPLLLWSELEPENGVYDWRALDKAVTDATNAGLRIAPRVFTNTDLFAQATPEWFFDLPAARSYYPSAEAQDAGYQAPVPWDPVYQREFGEFLTALGERYNGHAAIEFFQTNAGGGLYGEIVLSATDRVPDGNDPALQTQSIHFWVDRWLEAFPNSHLSLMVNAVGYGIGEDAAAYAASKGVYLQQNSPWLSPEAVALFKANEEKTRLVLEIEDAGCRSATGADFDRMIEAVFGYGFALDYLALCGLSFDDPSTASKLPGIKDRLRVN